MAEEDEDRGNSYSSTGERDGMIFVLEECNRHVSTSLRRGMKVKKIESNLSFASSIIRHSDSTKTAHSIDDRILKSIETEAALDKFQTDSAYLKGILDETIREIRSTGYFTTLVETVKNYEMTRTNELSILIKAQKNLEAVKTLRDLLSREKQRNEFEKDEVINELNRASRETGMQRSHGVATIAYVSAWEKSRCEQNLKRCSLSEDALRLCLEKLARDEKNEDCIRREIETFLNANIAKNQDNIAEWKNRYEKQWNDYDGKIKTLRADIVVEKTILDLLREEQRIKQGFIDKYLAEKEAIREEMEAEERRRVKTTKIQAWWRGVMVRRKLGPYRSEEKKKKKSGKSKK